MAVSSVKTSFTSDETAVKSSSTLQDEGSDEVQR